MAESIHVLYIRIDSSVAARTPIIFLTYIVAFGIFEKPIEVELPHSCNLVEPGHHHVGERDFHLVGWESLKVYSLRLIARLSVCIPQMELTSAQSPTNATIYILMLIPKLRAVLLMVCPIRLLENRPYPDKSKGIVWLQLQ